MREFFKFLIASILGSMIAVFLGFIFLFVVIAGIGAAVSSMGKDKETTTESNSIFSPDLSKPLVEKAGSNPFEYFDFKNFKANKPNTLSALIENIEKAKSDENIKGIYLNLSALSGGRATHEAIRRALVDFKSSEKPIYVYADFLTQGSYYLASVADSIFIQPTGGLDFGGLSMELTFFRGSFDKLEIEPRVIKHGRYKSFGEQFSNSAMSADNKVQLSAIMSSLYSHYLNQISASRNIDTTTLRNLANDLKIRNAKDALKYKLVDGLIYKDQMIDKLMKLTSVTDQEDLHLVDNNAYASSKPEINLAEDKIAVIYAIGEIGMGDGDEQSIGSDGLSRAIRAARLDEKVKAIVLRVNSPGGSALASDIILREAELAGKTKPFIVSMGDVAASGGYYIACKADRIVAEPNTITGSIGVIGFVPGMEKFFENKLGITFDRIKTGKYADLGSVTRAMSKEEESIIRHSINEVYRDFITHVGAGRKMDTSKVDSIGQGRVWTGLQAIEIGLVDELGGLERAIEIAAEKASLTEYKIENYPKNKNPFEEFGFSMGTTIKENLIKSELGDKYDIYMKAKALESYEGPQMLLFDKVW